MIFCQIALLSVWVKVQNMPRKDGKKPFEESFWYWRDFTSYLKTIGALAGFLLVVTVLANDQEWFKVTLGTLSSGVEAMMPLP